jgi:predicted dehydrogenase
MRPRFAAIGLDHRHIYDLAEGLIAAGMECAGYCPQTSDPRVLAGFRKRFPEIAEVPRERLMGDLTITVVVICAIPNDRAAIAIEAMRHGKDVMVDKPGVTSQSQLAEINSAIQQTGRILSVCFSERFLTPSTEHALALVQSGAIGRVVQVLGLGPHRLNRAIRPAWFFDRQAHGGILADIGSHQIDQFLTFTGARTAEIALAAIGTFGDDPAIDDFAELVLRSDAATGYARLDWFTADGLPSWGDGRAVILGTEGTIELRKNLDIEGRERGEHLFLADGKGTRHIACADMPVSYFRNFTADVLARSETAMTQAHCLEVCRLALLAQSTARRITVTRP